MIKACDKHKRNIFGKMAQENKSFYLTLLLFDYVKKLSLSYLFHQKLFNFLIQRDKHTQTDTPSLIRIQMGEIFNALFDTVHFTLLVSLTPFMKDKKTLEKMLVVGRK